MFELEKNLPKIQDFFARKEEVILAYLYGSYAAGQVWAESDLDIAVLFDTKIGEESYFAYRLRYIVELTALLCFEGVDVQELNRAPIEFRYQVLKNAQVLRARSEKERVDFETRTIIEYLDFKPALEKYYCHLIKRIKEGRHSARLAKYMAEVRAIAGRLGKAGKPSPTQA